MGNYTSLTGFGPVLPMDFELRFIIASRPDVSKISLGDMWDNKASEHSDKRIDLRMREKPISHKS